MANKEQASKWRKEHSDYRKNWYAKNKDKARAYSRQWYYDTVISKRMEETMASISNDEWKPIPGFENYRVNRDGVIINKFGRELKPGKLANGYMHVALSNDEVKSKHMYIHHAVWLAFNGEIPEGLLVCHIDTNRANNSLDNLCLMTHKENLNKPLTIEHYKRSQALLPRGGRKKKKVYQFDIDGNLVKTWECVAATTEGGFSPASVSRCCNGICEHHKGFVWSFNQTV